VCGVHLLAPKKTLALPRFTVIVIYNTTRREELSGATLARKT